VREVGAWLRDIAIAIIAFLLIRNFIGTPVRVQQTSMYDTLYPNDIMLVTRFVKYIEPIDRGDIVITNNRRPADGEAFYVKRVIGLPGETIAITNGQITINGAPLGEEPYILEPWSTTMDPLTLAEDEYFLLGDNRNGSLDSRTFGPFTKAEIQGKVICLIWPFERIGSPLHE